MNGISFMIDSRGTKTAAVIDLRRHGRMWEDFYDTLLAETRAKEPRESLSVVRRKRHTLRSLLAKVRPANRPSESDWGGARGGEVW
jgi:hypothetical protein